MSPMMESMLENVIVPRLRNAARSIPRTGCEDAEEIAQDATLLAARMIDSAEKAGRSFTAGNIVHYATQAAKSGRRSYYAGRSDVMSPGCLLDGKARLKSLDDPIEFETGDEGTMHDLVAPFDTNEHESDPAEEAARNLDWDAFLASHPPRYRVAILVLVKGGTMREAGKKIGIKDGAASLLKKTIANDLVDYFGAEVIRGLLDGIRPGWESDLRLARERQACLADVARVADVAR